MLEKLIEDTKVGDFVLDLHPSANNLFSTEGSIEKACLSRHQKFKDYIDSKINEDPQNNVELYKNGALHTLKGIELVLGGSLYLTAEAASRLSESIVRGTGRLANFGYQKAADQWTKVENFGQKVAFHYKNLKKKVPRSVKNLFHKVKDYLVVGASITAIGLSYSGIKSCGSEDIETDGSSRIEQETNQEQERRDPELYVPDERERTRPRQELDNERTRVPQPRPEPTPEPQCQTPDLSNNTYQTIANAAKKRANNQRTEYGYDGAPTSPLEGLTSNTNPGETKISWLKNRNKCNQFVGDALVEAGYKVPTYEMNNGSLHYKEIEQFPHERRFFDKVTNFCDIRPGQVMVIDYPDSGENGGHGEIIHSVDYDKKIVWSFGAHRDGAYKKKYELFQDANFSEFNECWEFGIKDVYVLKPR